MSLVSFNAIGQQERSLYDALLKAGQNNLARAKSSLPSWAIGKTFVVIDPTTNLYKTFQPDWITRLFVAIGISNESTLYGEGNQLANLEEISETFLTNLELSPLSCFLSQNSIALAYQNVRFEDLKAIHYAFISFGKPEVANQILQQCSISLEDLYPTDNQEEEDSRASLYRLSEIFY